MLTVNLQCDSLISSLRLAKKHVESLEPVLRQIGEYMLGSIDKNFDEQGRPNRWQALKEDTWIARAGGHEKAFTKKGKERKKFTRMKAGDKILTLSSLLRNSITYKVSPNGLVIGTNVIYAAAQQFGRNDGKRGSPLPARPYLVIQREDEAKACDMIEKYVVGNSTW